MADWCVEAGKADDLGLLLKLSQQTIPQKNMLAFWDQFGELFGMPIRIGKTTTRDAGELFPRMLKHGFPVKGLRFDWDESIDYTPEQQVAYETMIADRYDVDPAYFIEKYNVPILGRKNLPAPGQLPQAKPFFD